MKTIRIFISSPGDVAEERERAREVVESLRRRYAGRFWLKAVLWEDLPLQADASFQEGIDVVLDLEGGVDMGVFILWSRMGELQDGGRHSSGTEREFELLREARERSGGQRPALLVYARADDAGFAERLRGRSTAEQRELLEQKAMVESFIEETFQDAETGRNLRAFHSFDRPQTFSQRLRAHLIELLDELAGDTSGAGVVWDVESQGSPFMGLEAFGAEQAEVFFGREYEVLEGRRMLKENAREGCAFLLVTGASGSGKSSLARAGLLPELATHEVDETVAQWRMQVVLPGELGEDAVAGLVERMGSAGVLPELCAEGVDVSEVVAGLKRDAVTTVNLVVKRAAAEADRTMGGGVRVLLLVDQLEETFGWRREAREVFFDVLEALARSGVVWVVATVRGDFLGEVHESAAMGRLLAGQPILTVLSPDADALRRMIEEPARLAGLRFEEQGGRHLGERILADAARHADLLPLVEFVLLRLYDQRDEERGLLTYAAYDAMGGVEGALSRHAEEVFAGMGAEERVALASVLKRLVTLGEARGGSSDGAERVLRQRVALVDFGGRETAARRLVDALVEARLLTAGGGEGAEGENGTGGGVVTVAHEALLRVWPRAAAWVEGNRELLRVRARVAGRMGEQRTGVIAEGDPLLEVAKVHLSADSEAFSEEQRAFIERSAVAVGERQRRRERTRRAVLSGMAALTLAALASAGFAWSKQQQAEAAEKDLEKQLAETQHQFERWQLEEGRAWLLRARVAKGEGNHLSALLYAGRAVGFHEYGRLDEDEGGSVGEPYSSLLGAPLTVPAIERERISEEAEVRDFVQNIRPTCLPIWSSPLQEQQVGAVNCLAYSPDGTRVASGLDDGTVQIWGAASGKQTATLSGLSEPIYGLAFSPDGTRLAAGSEDRHLKLWDAISGREIASLDTGEPRVPSHNRRPPAPTGLRIVTPEPETEIETETAFVGIPFSQSFSSIVFSTDGKHLASGAKNGILTIWNAANGTEVAVIDGHESPVRSLAFNDNGTRIVTGSADASVKIWDVKSGREIIKLGQIKNRVTRVAFSPSGTRIACGFANGNIGLWNAENGERLYLRRVGPIAITTLLFSPDGKRLAASSTGAALTLWKTEELMSIGILGTDFGWIGSVAFSPDGTRLACASPDGTVKLWDAGSGKPLATIREHSARVMSVAFSPDGTRLVSGAEDGNLKLWDIAIDDSSGAHRSMDMLTLEREGYLQLEDREVVWQKPPPSAGGTRTFAPICWRNDLAGQLARAATESERMVLRLRMCDQSSQWRSMLGFWKLARESGMAGDAPVRREFGVRAAGALRQLVSLDEPEFPMDLWLALLAACEDPDDQDPRLVRAVGGVMWVLFGCSDAPEDLLSVIADGCKGNAFLRDAAASALMRLGFRVDRSGHLIKPSGSYSHGADDFLRMIRSQDEDLETWGRLRDRLELMQNENFIAETRSIDNRRREPAKASTEPKSNYTRPVGNVLGLSSYIYEGRYGCFSASGSLVIAGENWVKRVTAGDMKSGLDGMLLSGSGTGLTESINIAFINIALSSCGEVVAGVRADGSAKLWQTDKDLQLGFAAVHQISPNGIYLASGGRRWASVDRNGRTLLRALPGGEEVATLYAAARGDVVLAFAPDGQWLAGTNRSEENVAQIFDAKEGKLLRRLEGHRGIVSHVSVSPDGKYVATSSADGTARIWEAKNGKMRAVLKGHGGIVNKAGFDPAGKRVVTAASDGRARVWSLDGELLLEVKIPGDHALTHAGFSPDGRLLATASKDGRLRLWRAEGGDLLFDAEVDTSFLEDDMFSPDGSILALPWNGSVMLFFGVAGLGAEKKVAAEVGDEGSSAGAKDDE